MPGSHVIVKVGSTPLPDSTYEDAAKLAAYYSKGRNMEKVEIDYVEKKFVKKVPGAPLGFVIYNTNYSMNIAPDISGLTLLNT
jgi:predicted ribosome quality control (RQC) complex YloA/Tae2 family protein